MISEKAMQAFYSAEMEKRTGTVIWERADGTEVECTCVGQRSPSWPDTKRLGPVVKWVRKGRPATAF